VILPDPRTSAVTISERSVFYSAPDGLRLHVRITGDAQATRLPVVCLPGLTRNARDFAALAQILAGDPAQPRQVLAFDYRGRGQSAYDADWRNYTVLTETGDVLAGLAALNVAHCHLIGTSRGGLIAHGLAAARPGVMASVVLNDVGPEIGGAGLAQIRAALDRKPVFASWGEAETLVALAMAKAFPALTQADFSRAVHATFREHKGKIVPDFDPALINTLKAIDFSRPLPAIWPQFAGLKAHPLLTIRGETSALLTEDIVARMRQVAPAMQVITVKGQGHAPMLETGDLPKRLQQFFAKAEKSV
jgi:pimeloyl-ACP methyl ester carboxylesterase